VTLDGGVDREARLVEAQARTHIPHRRLRRLEIAPPSRKLIAGLVVVDQRKFSQRGLPAQTRVRQKGGGADRKDLLVHQIFDLAAGIVVGAADRHVERTVVEVALGDHGRDADVDLGGADEETLQFGHQPKGGDGGRGRHGDLLPSAPAIQSQERRLEFVEPVGEFLQCARRRGREDQLAALALKQARLEELLQRPDLMTYGRRRDAELRRGPREAEVTGGTLERPQCIQGGISPHASTPLGAGPRQFVAFPPLRKDCTEIAGERGQSFCTATPSFCTATMKAWAVCAFVRRGHPSLRAKRSNPGAAVRPSVTGAPHAVALDCFVARAPRNDGRGIARFARRAAWRPGASARRSRRAA
jgi:hypothetical protein